MKQNRTLHYFIYSISVVEVEVACSNNAPVVLNSYPTRTPPTLSFDELKAQYEGYYEYSKSMGANMINASSAYARGATGAGITIGITDSGLDNSHVEIRCYKTI